MKRRDAIRSMGLILGSTSIATSPLFLFAATAQTPLKIPELLAGNVKGTKKHYPLNVRAGSSRFLADRNTPTLGINSDYLGPTLRFKRGDQVSLDVKNALAETTTLHWHGLHIPASVDGGPHQIIQPGADWNPEFSIVQRAGTFWYHSHLDKNTGAQVYQGLAGMIIIDDETSDTLDLPNEYGVDDIPLIVQDRNFNEDGSFRYIGMHRDVMTGMYGDRLLVNGCINPVLTATRQKLRLRILNGANARSFSFSFSDGRSFQIIASDGGLLENPNQVNDIILAPAERAEIIVDVSNGAPVQLLGLPLGANSPFAAQGMMQRMIASGLASTVVLSIEPQSTLESSPLVPTTLTSFERFQRADAVRQRNFKLSMVMGMGGGMMRGRNGAGNSGGMRGMMGGGSGNFFINDKAMDMAVINERIPVGSLEVWQIENDSMMTHPFHVHHGQFQLISRNGRPPAGIELGEKDTIKVAPGETLQFLMKFDRFADPNHAYMYHCHILEHEDNGMMGQFTVE